MENRNITVVPTTPHEGQKPGTSGLRKKVKVFEQENYTENFIQAIFSAYGADDVKGKTFVVGGDGRYLSEETTQKICEIAAGNGVKKLLVGQHTLLCTPAVSCVVRKTKSSGAILLTASHNPGGPNADFGIKFNCSNGGPAPEKVTDRIFEICNTISSYKKCTLPKLDVHTLGVSTPIPGFSIEVIDPVVDYVDLLQTIFDMDSIKNLCTRPDFRICFDGMNGVAGPYGTEMFTKVIGCTAEEVMRCTPLPDFGGCHPDPNLVYAKELVEIMYGDSAPEFGAACDGDADRNMILGNHFFVNPSDSVAIIAAFAQECIPYFKENFVGVARSMPTSCALDRVAKKKGLECFETPTGWKFFGNLMDSGRIQLCGEESFGTGGDHVREKDGLWAILCWLSIIAMHNKDSSKPLVSVKEIVTNFWNIYGRCFYSRYDYETVSSESANQMIAHLLSQTPESINKTHEIHSNPVVTVNNFCYTDPVDSSVSENQGVRVVFEDGSRVVFRLSGTGSSGATIRMYIESYNVDQSKMHEDPQVFLKPLIDFGLAVSNLKQLTGRKEPTVIT
eukprot:GHVH01001428.1.p1 GENE.GHVH01001428.1~~GHVH01001428.1.p1  ORF type:complete len:561 (+),score=90.43 GHVH01001428.1:95-1777(+)